MKALTTNAFSGYASVPTGWRERKRRARQTLQRAGAVLVVLVLGGALHALRWAGMLGL